MRNRISTSRAIFTAAALSLASTGLALAQSQPATPGMGTTPGTSTTPGMGTTPGMTAPGTNMGTGNTVNTTGSLTFGTQQSSEQWLGSNLMSRTVYSQDGTNIGEINDVVIDRTGTIQSVVIGVGGFLGIGEKDVAVPFSAMTVNRVPNASSENDSVRVVVRATRAELQAAPSFREYDWRAGANNATGTTGTGTGTGMGTGAGTGTGAPAAPRP